MFLSKTCFILELFKHDSQWMINTHENNINNFTQIVLPNEPDETKKNNMTQVNTFDCFYYDCYSGLMK